MSLLKYKCPDSRLALSCTFADTQHYDAWYKQQESRRYCWVMDYVIFFVPQFSFRKFMHF